MAELVVILQAEDRYVTAGEPSLGEAYSLLKERWAQGARDLETGLHLLFLSWYACSEPPFLTGLPASERTADMFREVFEHFGGESADEPDVLFAVGLMASLFPWCIGDETVWQATADRCTAKFRRLIPTGFKPEHFANRGAFGQYFAHMVRSKTQES
ncbi:MAG TPA: hypothetical protein VHP11_11760 [Tepidisphaeraceae bacterium]|nr:hypothetical protein [Tepidisphaeraceae bacterium]